MEHARCSKSTCASAEEGKHCSRRGVGRCHRGFQEKQAVPRFAAHLSPVPCHPDSVRASLRAGACCVGKQQRLLNMGCGDMMSACILLILILSVLAYLCSVLHAVIAIHFQVCLHVADISVRCGEDNCEGNCAVATSVSLMLLIRIHEEACRQDLKAACTGFHSFTCMTGVQVEELNIDMQPGEIVDDILGGCSSCRLPVSFSSLL